MKPTDPQFLYMILVLPALFGLTLVGEGMSKVLHEEKQGWVNVVFGVMFIGVVGFAFIFFSRSGVADKVERVTIQVTPTEIPRLGK